MALSAKVGSFLTGTGAVASNVVVNDVGFQPKAILFWWNGRASTSDASGRASSQRGYGTALTTTNRFTTGSYTLDAAASGDSSRSQDDLACVTILSGVATIDGELDFVSFDAGGFTLVVDNQFGTSYVVNYLALGGADITDVAVGSFSQAASTTGDLDVTAPGFQPDCVLAFGGGRQTFNTTLTDDAITWFSACDASLNQWVLTNDSNDGAATMQTISYFKTGEFFAVPGGAATSIDARASITSMLSNGFRLNFSENGIATASVGVYIALKGGQYKVGTVNTRTDGNDIDVTLGFQPAGALFGSHCNVESTADTVQDNAEWSMGAFDSTSNRTAMATSDQDAAADSVVSTAYESDAVYANIAVATGAVEGLMDIKTVASTGMTLVMDDTDPSAAIVGYAAFGNVVAAGDIVLFRRIIEGDR